MTTPMIQKLVEAFGQAVVRHEQWQDETRVWVAREQWLAVSEFARDTLALNHFVDLTAVDHLERDSGADRFELVLMLRAQPGGQRLMLLTTVPEDAAVATLCSVWAGANWAEREVWDMFGIRFEGHPDMRRILLYEQFEGYPLRKDYPIEKAQPLVPYREESDLDKLPPFGPDEGQPFSRINWARRVEGRDAQVSPSIALQTAQRRTLSDSEAAQMLMDKIRSASGTESAEAESPGGEGGN